MKPTNKHQLLSVVLVSGLLITGGCGSEGGSPSDYKAENSLDGNGNPTTITNTASSPAQMGIGDVYTVTFDSNNAGTINFEGTSNSAQFVLAINAIDTVQSSHSVQLSDEDILPDESADIAAPEDDSWKDMSAREALDQQLRGAEMELSADPNLEKAIPNLAATSAMKAMFSSNTPAVGNVESFKVLGSLSSLSSYKTVQAETKCIGSNVIFYVDSQVAQYNSSDLTNEDVQKLCTEFDRVAGEEFAIFGEPSDVNDDGHVAVLMTPQVNRLGAMGGGIITGFFFANDLYSGTNSNNREIIYVMVPDSNGVYGMSIPKSFAMDNLLPAVLPHELQHAISYNQKVFVSGGAPEENWLNEGLSHLSEDLMGYGQENPSRVEIYLGEPASYGPITAGSPGLAERGAIYLLLRYLYEQAANGDNFVWNLLHSNLTGTENLETAFGGASEDFDQTSEFLLRWTSAIVMSSYNLSTDTRFSYAQRVLDSDTNHWHGVCLDCDTEDGRGTILSGVSLSTYYGVSQVNLEATASKFYKVTSFPQQISLTAKSAGSYGATLIRFQ